MSTNISKIKQTAEKASAGAQTNLGKYIIYGATFVGGFATGIVFPKIVKGVKHLLSKPSKKKNVETENTSTEVK